MNIKTKLLITTFIEVSLVVLLTSFLFISSGRIKTANLNEQGVTKVVATITELRSITFEYLLNPTERSFEQWQIKNTDLEKLISSLDGTKSYQHELLTSITSDSKDVKTIFNRLAGVDLNPLQVQNSSTKLAVQERLATQLLMKQQSVISDATTLATRERQEALRLEKRTSWLVGLTLLVLLLITAFNAIFITRSITKALNVLLKGAGKMATGNLAYRVKLPHKNNEFGKLGAAFNSMAASLEKTDNIRSEFILIASHQLRTPLTALKWYTEELLFSSDDIDKKTRKNYTREVYASNERMIRLVDRLLIASKIGFGNLTTSPELIQIASVLKAVLHDLSPQSHKHGITIIKAIDKNLPHVWIDPTWMELILQNILSNAVKYSPSGKRVEVTLRKEGSNILIIVKDNGYGIPRNEQDRIFTRLFRADNARKIEGEGSGLGLYIAKAMIERASGKIWFESIENKGTTFFIQLPIKTPEKNNKS